MSYNDIPDETATLLKELSEWLDILGEGDEAMVSDPSGAVPRGAVEKRVLDLCEYLLSLGIEGRKLVLPILAAKLDYNRGTDR